MKILGLILTVGVFSVNATAAEVYRNSQGCVVEIEKTLKGTRYLITDRNNKIAILGVLDDSSVGDIKGFCANANVVREGEILVLGCTENQESGAYTTRGFAEVDHTNGLTSVEVEGQYKRFGFWKVDTKIACYNLKAVK